MVCLSTLTFWLEAKSQYLHLYGFSPVCIIICLFIDTRCIIVLLQNGHPNCALPSLIGSFCKIIKTRIYLQKKKKNHLFCCHFKTIQGISMVFLNMCVEIWFLNTRVVAIFTMKGFLSSMSHDMSFNIS